MTCNHAIPRGTHRTHSRLTHWVGLVCCIAALLLTGCKKKAESTHAMPGGANVGGDGANNPPAPGDGASGRNTILQMPFDNVAKLVLLNIGQAYKMAAITNNKPPKDAVELDVGPKGLKTTRDMQDHEVEVIYGVNPAKLDNPADYLLAWEKEPTNDGYRMVLMADFVTVKYVSKAEFEKMKRAK